ncbi:polysaccharide lyase family 7 protein [Cellulophaga sp. HaHaR_3_176]|uniref:polysaccharide lyase family 7 protein n=1 Tax=Cellulophaga sp. HaHaR_3_176 TaxID=1942464 RepID=UPI001C1FA6B0|nr:polysaccharide lyase family 7 protein [Cellulophaga sp. HaHaR_3_176]QWX84935.1 polysaccharide lyase family 7 protein [Cellulophaga sp. HaHaR_3_176]
MNNIRKEFIVFLTIILISVNATSQKKKSSVTDSDLKIEKRKSKKNKKIKISKIDLSHWKVTLPIANEKRKPIELESPEILDFANNETVKPYFYNDSTDGSIVFHAFPNTTTTNTKYSRTELREQIIPGDNNTNWTFEEGGTMKGKLSIEKVSKDADGKYHRIIIMQIHGRLSNNQKKLIGAKDNNAPPILKIYWDKGKIRVKTKILKNRSVNNIDILRDEAWGDDKGYNFPTEVGFRKFTLEVKVEKGKMMIILNNSEYAVYEGVDINRWNIFENYFKAGNYFQSKEQGSYSKVKYYELEVSH